MLHVFTFSCQKTKLHKSLSRKWNIMPVVLRAQNAMQMKSLLIWDFTQHTLVVSYRRFRRVCRSRLQESSNSSRMPVTLVIIHGMVWAVTSSQRTWWWASWLSQMSENNYQSAPRKIQEEQRSHIDRVRSLKSRICVDHHTLILNKNSRIKVISDSGHYCVVLLKCRNTNTAGQKKKPS